MVTRIRRQDNHGDGVKRGEAFASEAALTEAHVPPSRTTPGTAPPQGHGATGLAGTAEDRQNWAYVLEEAAAEVEDRDVGHSGRRLADFLHHPVAVACGLPGADGRQTCPPPPREPRHRFSAK